MALAQTLASTLRHRRPEIEQAAMARVYAVSGIGEITDPIYAEGLRAAVKAALDYGFSAIEAPGDSPAPVPAILLSQARLAARRRVGLDTVLRRYFAGYRLLGDIVVEQVGGGDGIPDATLKGTLHMLASRFDTVVAAVSKQYADEAGRRADTAERRRIERIQGLLDGDPLETADLNYGLADHHLAAIASGPGAREGLRDLAAALDRRLLLVCPDQRVWVWLGGGESLDSERLAGHLESVWPAQACLALGETGEGLLGWRLSHQQAAAALPIAMRRPGVPIRYGEVALLTGALADDLLSTSLRRLYLRPLECDPDQGALSRATLRAYFATERNVSSAAAAMGLNRSTVAGRLRSIEERIGSPIARVAAELEVALGLEELSRTEC